MTRRTLIILLIVSGGLNLFLAGIIATSIFVHLNRAGDGPGPRAAFHLYRAIRGLDEPHRSRARALLREGRPQVRARIRAVRAARRDLRRMIRDGRVSDEAIDAGFRALDSARGAARLAMRDLVRQIAAPLTAEQRRRFYRSAYRWRGRGDRLRRLDGPDPKG